MKLAWLLLCVSGIGASLAQWGTGSLGPGSPTPPPLGKLPGESIEWRTINEKSLNETLGDCLTMNRPALVYFHTDSCGACVKLMRIFLHSRGITETSSQFLMVKVLQGLKKRNTTAEEDAQRKLYRPDGGYTPRILFYNTAAEFQPQLYNALGNANFKYFYHAESQILESMWRAAAFTKRKDKQEL